MLSVFMLFLLPVGGGIPAGVLLARANGLSWPLTAGLYFVSDVVLAVAFEPVLRLLAALGRKVRFLARCGAIMSKAMARNSAYFVRTGAGPITLIMISFGGIRSPGGRRRLLRVTVSWLVGASRSRATCCITPFLPSQPYG